MMDTPNENLRCDQCLTFHSDNQRCPTAAHTPGPWTSALTVDHDGRVCVNGDGYVVALACPTGSSSYSPTYRQREANARLIAAAPDLLAALKNLLKAPALSKISVKEYAAITDVLTAAEAAIAKAEGVQ